jgi:hypothetical protein
VTKRYECILRLPLCQEDGAGRILGEGLKKGRLEVAGDRRQFLSSRLPCLDVTRRQRDLDIGRQQSGLGSRARGTSVNQRHR